LDRLVLVGKMGGFGVDPLIQGITFDQVANITGLSIQEVEQLKNKSS